MKSDEQIYDVLIAGCGPTGATLANILRLSGHRVAIFDRDKAIFSAPRAMQIDAESARVFQSIGVQQRLGIEDARPAVHHAFVDEKRKPLLELAFDVVDEEQGYSPAGLRFHQPTLERLLREDLSVSVDAFYGQEVVEVGEENGFAQLTAKNVETNEITQFQGKYLVGADGGNSLCKKYIGSDRVDFGYSRKWIVIDIVLNDQAEWDRIKDRSEFKCAPDGAVVFVKGCHNCVRFDFEVDEETAATFDRDDAIELMSEYIDTTSVEFLRLAPYHFYAGMPAEWRKGKVFLIGDAAHLTSPFSGQGLNMGIRDASNLGFKLDLVLKEVAPDSLLDTYHAERWENCKEVIQGATNRGLMISASTLGTKIQQRLGFFIGRLNPRLAVELTRRMSPAVPYVNGLIGAHALAGSLLIQPLVRVHGQEKLLDDVLGRGFSLLTKEPIQDSPDVTWFKDVLNGVVCEISILVRPDRYVFDAGGSGKDLCARLRSSLKTTTNGR